MMHSKEPVPQSTPIDLSASTTRLRDITSPRKVADLLNLARDPSAHGQLASYDKLFIQGSKILFDAGEVFVTLKGEADLVRINDKYDPESSAPTVKELRAQRPEVSGLTVSDSFRIRARNSQGILISAGAFLSVIDESGRKQLLTLTRTEDAEIAPGEIQGPSGRCDRSIGMACFVELAEETLIVAEKNGVPVLLGIRGTPYLSDEDSMRIIRDARTKALQTLENQLAKTSDVSSPEAKEDLDRLILLRSAEEILLVDASPDPHYHEKIHTILDNVNIESLDGMFCHYDYDTNTFEARKALTLDLRQHEGLAIKGLFDGDGFGRTVNLRDFEGPWPDDKLTSTLKRFLSR